MSRAQTNAFKKLSDRQKVAFLKKLLLDAASDKSPVPANHQKTLDERWHDYKAGKIKKLNLAELERRLDQK